MHNYYALLLSDITGQRQHCRSRGEGNYSFLLMKTGKVTRKIPHFCVGFEGNTGVCQA
jgi:hypothetical protein